MKPPPALILRRCCGRRVRSARAAASWVTGTKLEGKSTRPGVYKCKDCRKPFSVTVNTVMERSKVPLTKWLLAAQLMASSKKGFSALQLMRYLGEFDFRANTRNISDAERADALLSGAKGKRLMYRQPD